MTVAEPDVCTQWLLRYFYQEVVNGHRDRRVFCERVQYSNPPFFSFFFLKSQDFLIMFIHHLATVGLISFSYVNNMARVGSLVLCVHDASDFLLEVSWTPW